MSKILLSTLAVIGLLSGRAMAADMPVAHKAPPVQRCAADQFRGGYVGVNGGAVNWTANRTDQDEVLVDTATIVQKSWAGMVGAQAGYNFGTCNTIYGIEIDGDWISGNVTTQLIPNVPLLNLNIHSRWDALVTARGRAGVVIDNLLLYVTGGAAAGHFRTTYTNQFLGIPGVAPATLFQANTDQWRWGVAAGVGAEWAFSSALTLRTEVLYVDFVESSHRALFFPPATFASFKESDSAWIGRIGVNYRFSSF